MYWITNWYYKYERSKIKIEMQKQRLIKLIVSTPHSQDYFWIFLLRFYLLNWRSKELTQQIQTVSNI